MIKKICDGVRLGAFVVGFVGCLIVGGWIGLIAFWLVVASLIDEPGKKPIST